MSWIYYALAVYLAASYGLLIYLLAKLVLGKSMRFLVGDQSLHVTRPPFRTLVLPRSRDHHHEPIEDIEQVTPRKAA